MIYFDNSATTRVCKESADKAYFMMTECFGNPSSLHSFGYNGEKEVSIARKVIANKLGSDEKEIFFTSGGTESNNLAIFGGANAKKRFGNRIVTTSIEHRSVLEAMKQLEKDGFEVVYIKPDSEGEIDINLISNAVDSKTILVSIMSVNNETGLMLPIEKISGIIKRKKSPALFHVDNVQGFGKLKLVPKKLGIDLMSISGHKVHAPKGIGALYVSSKARILPRNFGGGQEKGIRPGTEAVPNIAAFGEAVSVLPGENDELIKIEEIRNQLISELKAIDGVIINSRENTLPYILNISCGKIRGETMLHFLEEKEIFVSTGSACSGAKPSHVLSELGFSKERVESSLRLSFSRYNSLDEVVPFIKAFKEGMENLAHR